MYQKIKNFCPHCSNISPQKLIHQHAYECTMYDADGKKSTNGTPCEYFIFTCETCDELLLYHSFGDDEPTLFYPKNNELDKSVPEKVAHCYTEAVNIKNRAPTAYAIMIRKGLEAICDDRKIKKGTLFKRLKALEEKGEIPSNLITMSDVLRELGNAAAHDTELKVTVPLTWGMDGFFRAIVEYVYVAPNKIKEFKERIQKKKT